jgi:hypothetical protein
MSIRPFINVLRKQGGWKLDYDSRAGGDRVRQFSKQVTKTRTVELQFWSSGLQRATFMESGRMSTPPTEFTTPDSMLAAIVQESKRAPAPYR